MIVPELTPWGDVGAEKGWCTPRSLARPARSARCLARKGLGRFLPTVEADSHTVYGLSDCVDSAIEDYIVNLTISDPELVCA